MPAGRHAGKAIDIITAREDWGSGRGFALSSPHWCDWCGFKRAYRQLPDGYLCEVCAEGKGQ